MKNALMFWIFLALTNVSAAQDLDWLSEQFIEVALGQEYREGYSYLKRWPGDVSVSVNYETQLPAVIDQLIDEQLRLLAQAAKLKIDRVTGEAAINLFFVKSTSMQRVWKNNASGEIPADALCVSQIRSSKSGEILRGVILIPVDRASERGKLLSCIVEELTQSLGLINDSPDLFPSIFNDHSNNQMMTSLDWLLVRTLYDADLSAGMTVSEVRSVLKSVLNRLINEGVQRDAEQRLRASVLYPLLEIN